MAIEDPVPEFTERDTGLIDLCLPETVDPRRRKLLPQILRDWSSNELFEHMHIARRATPERRKSRGGGQMRLRAIAGAQSGGRG